eukprot:TRINITY_DN8547_c0_g1_i1.p1 TRINITY_DN8547_c0_g1~~TRINITY_DN8547_c0_g1_i1.p1  ORF type:complete len:439 (-),score=60.08 TRINITY_DN8547_c0_g1_i1:1974-3290(-)
MVMPHRHRDSLICLFISACLCHLALGGANGTAQSVTCATFATNLCTTGSCVAPGVTNGTLPSNGVGVYSNFLVPSQPASTFLTSGFISKNIGSTTSGSYDVQIYLLFLPFQCCLYCKAKSDCQYWIWADKSTTVGVTGAGVCYMYQGASTALSGGPTCISSSTTAVTYAGAKCAISIKDDPHLVGAHGTRYDFNGLPDQSFCLVTDKKIHINMLMTGYYDDRLESASLVLEGKAVRTWIRELGIVWVADDGAEHKLRLAARGGKEVERGSGFMERMELDGREMPRLEVGGEPMMEGGLFMKLAAIEKRGKSDVDVYILKVGSVLEATLRLRVAHPKLQTPDDVRTHISLDVTYLKATPSVHGVLGQTYGMGRKQRAESFAKIAASLHHDIAADAESGMGFLDGVAKDYVSSHVLSADCRYTSYGGQFLPATGWTDDDR